MADGVRRGGGGTQLPTGRGAAARRSAGDQPADHESGKGSRGQAFRPEQPFGAAHRRRRRLPGAVPGGPAGAGERRAVWPATRGRASTARSGSASTPDSPPTIWSPWSQVLRREHPHLELDHRHLQANPGHPEDAPRPGAGRRARRRPRQGTRTGEDGRSRRHGSALCCNETHPLCAVCVGAGPGARERTPGPARIHAGLVDPTDGRRCAGTSRASPRATITTVADGMTMLAFVAAGVGIGFSSLNAVALTPRQLAHRSAGRGLRRHHQPGLEGGERHARLAHRDPGRGAPSALGWVGCLTTASRIGSAKERAP